MFLDIHVLQDVPYANLNRDDTGSPKTAQYGGVPRLRVSSQAWKRPTRLLLDAMLTEAGGTTDPTRRTTQYVEQLTSVLVDRGWDTPTADAAARVAFKSAKIGFPKDKADEADDDTGAENADDGKKRVLMFLSDSQYADLADYLDEHRDDVSAQDHGTKDAPAFKNHRKALEAVISEKRGLVRLFGRMIAQLPAANTDSAIQVAHALTVHAQVPETDYLTAVDDVKSADLSADRGASGIYPTEYASGYFYRYATVSLETLARNGLGHEHAAELAALAAEAFVLSLPTGKASATAPHTRPDLVLVQVRDRQPMNLVSAFERPIRSTSGYGAAATSALASHLDALTSMYGPGARWTGFLAHPGMTTGSALETTGTAAASLTELLSQARQVMTA